MYPYKENLGYPQVMTPVFNPFVPTPCVESLLRKTEDGYVKPWLASGWEWSDDFSSITLSLQKGVKFHDGTDFNAEAVKIGEDILREGIPTEIAAFSSVEVLDDYTIRFNLSEISNEAIYEFTLKVGQAAAISPTAVGKYGADYNITHPVGTGPFTFVNYTKDVGVKYTKNNNYWIAGQPYLDNVEYIYIADPVTGKTAFLAGEGNAYGTIEPVDAYELQQKGDFEITIAPATVLSLIGDSAHQDSPFAKLEVRQAVSYAIDNQSIVDGIGYGFLEASTQHAYPGHAMYNEDIEGYPYNPEKARELLTAAGYPNGFDTTITYDTGMGYDTTVVAIQRYLSDVGIEVELKPVTPARKSELAKIGWDGLLIYRPYMAVGYPAQKTMLYYLSENAVYNVSAIRPTDIEDMLAKSLSDTNEADISKDLKDLNSLIIDKYCLINPLYVLPALGAFYPEVQDAQMWDPWQEVWTPEKAWLKK
jgi:ABC-type transport system substrate-binding protein